MDFSLEATTVVDAPRTRVFDLITDIDRLPVWNAEVAEIVEPCPVLEVGGEWVVEIRAMHTHWDSRSRVTEIDLVRGHFSYRSQSDDGNPSYAEWRWEIDEDPAGSRVRVSVDVHPRTFWRKHLLSNLRRGSLERAMNESLVELTEAIASPPAKITNEKEQS